MLCVDVKCIMIVSFVLHLDSMRLFVFVCVCVYAFAQLENCHVGNYGNEIKRRLEILPFAAEEAINCKLLDLPYTLFHRKEYDSN